MKMATSTFNFILQQIQHSNLNFQLQVTPFSAVIFLEKSFVKDKLGVPLISNPLGCLDMGISQPPRQPEEAKNILETELISLREKYENMVQKCSVSFDTIDMLSKKVIDRDEIIKDLELANASSKAAANNLNRSLT